MSKVVHVQTTITTVFGVLDDAGNVIPQQPIQATVGKFAEDAFTEAYAAIAAERDKAIAGMEPDGAATEPPEQTKRASRKPKR